MSEADTVFDVVVIGSGAGAWALIKPLMTAGLSVLVLERAAEDEAQLAVHGFTAEGRAIGGGTALYTGNVLRFAPSDFHRRRDLGAVAGVADWPLTYEELAPYYDAIEAELGVAGDAAQNPFEPPRSRPYPLPAVPLDRAGELGAAAARSLGWHPFPIPTVASAAHGRAACARCGLCTGFVCQFNARWSARGDLLRWASDARITLRAGATVVRILADGDRATGVEYADAHGLHVARGRVIVVAANAIQTPRLLLQSATSEHPHGLGNDSGLVGRHLMTHVMEGLLTIGHVPGPTTTAAAGCTLAIQDFYDRARSGVALPFTLEPRTIGAVDAFARITRSDASWAKLDDPALAERHRTNVVTLAMVEDLPQPENRVTLHPTERDELGQPKPVVTYRPHALDIEAANAAASRARQLLEAAGARDIITVAQRNARFHLMGTCRMGNDASSSVVDRDGRSHRIKNLFVGDSSLFVTSAGVNPSLTVQALVRRVGERIVALATAREV